MQLLLATLYPSWMIVVLPSLRTTELEMSSRVLLLLLSCARVRVLGCPVLRQPGFCEFRKWT